MSKNSSAKYYQDTKTTKRACKRCPNLSKEENGKKWQYDREQYRNLPEDEKQRLVEYRKDTSL